MRKKIQILSERAYEKWASWAVVYEWEDVFSEIIKTDIKSVYASGKIGREIRRMATENFEYGKKYKNGSKYKLAFVMNADLYRMFTMKGVVPIFLDFSYGMIDTIMDATKELPIYWVTCLDIYANIKQRGGKNVRYIPLSISDKYLSESVPSKDIDVIQFGRKNSVLHDFMLKYCEANDVEYVYQTSDGSLEYYSTKRGNIGRFDSRDEYMTLLSRAKISLVSTPGRDSSRDFGGIDFITPRFYESAAMYSHMIGRYTDNEEAKIIGIDRVCANISNYNEFENAMNYAIHTPCEENLDKYRDFLKENCTSMRAKVLLQDILTAI